MTASPRERFRSLRRRLRQFERRELRAFRRWIEHTENLIHLVVLVVVPVLLAFVTFLANATPFVSFLVYPPLASGTYMLFAEPEGPYASPRKFVGGMTLGALCGWISLEVTARYWYFVPPEQFQVHAGATALSVFLTGLFTWLLDLEEPTAFSTALLVLVSGAEQFAYVLGIAVSSLIVAGAYSLWYDHFYEHRAQYLFQTVKGDDHVLVPIRDEQDEETALFAAYLAAAHDAGKVVLFDTVSDEDIETADDEARPEGDDRLPGPAVFDTNPDSGRVVEAHGTIPDATLDRLQTIEEYIETTAGIPCEMVVVREDPDDPDAVLNTAYEVNCDLIVTSTDLHDGQAEKLSPFVLGLFGGDVDVIAFSPTEVQTNWSRMLVMVRRPGELAHAMLDFAHRLAPRAGNVSVCTCIEREMERTQAELALRDLVGSFAAEFETRVAYGSVEDYLAAHSGHYDLVMIGASTDRSVASRFISPPTVERLEAIDCDLAIVHRG